MSEQPKSLSFLGTTAEKEGMSEEDFKTRVKVVKEQLEWWKQFQKTHHHVVKDNIGSWELNDVVA